MRLRTAFTLLGLLSLPAVAAAGPIGYDYRITTVLNQGTPSPGPLVLGLDYEGHVPPPADGPAPLGIINFGSSPAPQLPDSYTAFTSFNVFVRVTDRSSGRVGTLRIDGDAIDMWDYRAWDGRWTNSYHVLQLGDAFADDPLETSAV